jgi:eukaryotic-like serine/threonine-protein kinase
VDSSPLLGRTRCLVASTDGWLYCITIATGKKVWSYQVGASLTGSPAFAQDKIIIGAEDGSIYAFGNTSE